MVVSSPRIPWFTRVCSFDLFDTLVSRRVIRPADAFAEVERRMGGAGRTCTGFAEARERSEFELRKSGDFKREVTLEGIYAALANALGRDQAWIDEGIASELQTERDLLYPVPAGVDFVNKARRRGKQIVFVSDTYLPRAFLQPLLESYGILCEADRLYLSVESGLMKSTGELFHHVAESEGISPGRFFHLGDNLESDVTQARRVGWNAAHFSPTLANRYERPATEPEDSRDHLAQSFFHGLQRQTRLTHPSASEGDRVLRDTTIGVSAPLLIAFTRWCLQRAVEKKITRLYFLSRDGEIILKIAERLNRAQQYPVELRYLYASRQALLLPSISGSLQNDLEWILAPTAILSPRIVLRRINLAPEDLDSELKRAGFPATVWDTHLDESARKRLSELLLEPALSDRIREEAEKARGSVTAYLQQEELTRDARFAIVDIGWRGTLQSCVSKLLSSLGHEHPVTGLYYGLMGRKRFKPEDELDAFFFDTSRPSAVDTIDYLIPVLEMFVAAQHGGVSGYRSTGGSVEPIFRSERNERALAWGLKTQQDAMLALADAFADHPAFETTCPAVQQDTIRNLEQFARCPTRAEARVFGGYLDAEDQNESVFVPLAQPFSLAELRRHRDHSFLHHHNEWRAAAVALTHPLYRRWLGVENTIDEKHPVCESGLKPVEGFGPVEGPAPQFHLPRFVWAYGPRFAVEVTPSDNQPVRITLDLKNYHADQNLEFSIDGEVRQVEAVPQNFGEQPTEPCRITIDLKERKEKTLLVIRPTQWEKNDRPLAVIVSRVAFSQTGAT